MLPVRPNTTAPLNLSTKPPEQKSPEKKRKWPFSTANTVIAVILILVLAGFVWSFLQYRAYKTKATRLSTPEGQQELATAEIQKLVEKVGRHIVLPKDEEPTVATVMDAAGLAKTQPFYKEAKNGEKVLLYVKAQKAIIYDEELDRLINVGPIMIEAATTTAK